MDLTVEEANISNALPVTPTSSVIELPESGDLMDSRSHREQFNLRDRAEELKSHRGHRPKLI